MRSLPALCLAVSLLSVPFALAQSGKPVMYGGDPDMDACTTLGRVSGLDSQGDNFLAVRAGPGSSFPMLDKLGPDASVMICDGSGSWLGIVYGGEGCGVTSPVAKRQPYRGPCRSGWVFGKYVVEFAG